MLDTHEAPIETYTSFDRLAGFSWSRSDLPRPDVRREEFNVPLPTRLGCSLTSKADRSGVGRRQNPTLLHCMKTSLTFILSFTSLGNWDCYLVIAAKAPRFFSYAGQVRFQADPLGHDVRWWKAEATKSKNQLSPHFRYQLPSPTVSRIFSCAGLGWAVILESKKLWGIIS